jgi:raffinose/stachyose/melibiose transport system permease protein
MTKKLNPTRIVLGVLSNLIMTLFSITCVFPIVWIMYSSLKTVKDFDSNIIGLPKAIDIGSYAYILTTGRIGSYMSNTVRNTLVSLIFIVFFAFVNGYFISRFKFRGRRVLYSLYLIGMLVPIHALLVPLYIVFTRTGIDNKWFTVVLPNIVFNLPVSLFLVESYIGTVPRELEEAALLEGSSFSRTMFTIIFPLTTPILVTVGIMAFFSCWNEFTFSLVLLKNQRLFSLPLGLTLFKGMYQSNYPRIMTTMVIALFPALIVYIAFSKKIIQGMMSGAIKG